MNNYTVILLLPDYLAENYGQDNEIYHVEADNTRAAEWEALETAASRYDVSDREDFYVIAIFAGHLDDLRSVEHH